MVKYGNLGNKINSNSTGRVLQMAAGGVRTADAGAHLGKGGGTWHLSNQQTTTPKI